MEVSKVTREDGKFAAQLLNLLQSGRWELSGGEMAAYVETCLWVKNHLMEKMAADLRSQKAGGSLPDSAPAPAEGGYRVKGMGSLPSISPGKPLIRPSAPKSAAKPTTPTKKSSGSKK